MARSNYDGAAMIGRSSIVAELIERAARGGFGCVVWFIAGMALLVSGIIAEARIDTRMAQLHYFKSSGCGGGDGAINLALAEQEGMRASGQRGADRLQNYQIGPRSVEVRMIPAGVFVNISSENLQGLRSLFRFGASEAQQRGILWEGSPAGLGSCRDRISRRCGWRRGGLFHSPEDLLRVPGVSRGVYEW